MRNRKFFLAGTVLLLLLSSCTSVKRFKSAEYKGADNALVDVELFSSRLALEPMASQDMYLWDLSANAQTRLLQILDARYPENGQFMRAVSKNYRESGEAVVEDYTRKDLQMVFTISRDREYDMINDPSGRFSPADRIEYLKLSLEIPEEHKLKFTRWNRYSTEYGEIDIADVSFSRSLELDAGGEAGGVDLKGGATWNKSEKQVIGSRYLKLNGSLSAHQLVLEEEGTREADLSGNISANVSLEFGAFPERLVVPVYSDSGDLVIQLMDVLVPALEEAPDTLFARLSLEYIYRHVQTGWSSYAEWDDRVEYYSGRVEKRVPLFTAKDYLPGFYCIGSDVGERTALKYSSGNGNEYLLQFQDYQAASQFLDWLSRPDRDPGKPVYMGSSVLTFRGETFTPTLVSEKGLKLMPVY
jgi:hypothetical protein